MQRYTKRLKYKKNDVFLCCNFFFTMFFSIYVHSLRYVSLRKIWCLLRCVVDYALMYVGLRPRVSRVPVSISVEPANVCNLRCPQCALGSGMIHPRAKMLKADMLRGILNEVSDSLLSINFFFQGEPLLNRDLPDLIAMAHERKIYTLCSTNAQLVDAHYAERLVSCGLDRLIISMDGHNQQSYEQYRIGGDIELVYSALRHLAEAKHRLGSSTPVIELQCLLLKSTEGSIDFLRNNYKRLGADVLTLKTAQFYNYEHGNALMPSEEKHSRYHLGTDGSYHLKGRLIHRCWRLVSAMVIDAHGAVRACCFDKQGEYTYGNIDETDIRTLWHSSRAVNFRQAVMQYRENIDICRNCDNV